MIHTQCAFCRRACVVRPRPKVQQPHIVAVCRPCSTMDVRTAKTDRLGARTFYVTSATGTDALYTVKVMGVKATCTCPNYVHVGQVLHQPCKHTRLVRWVGRAHGGIRMVPAGKTFVIFPTVRREARAAGSTPTRRQTP